MELASLTLRAWYSGHFCPLFHADARPRTIESYLDTVAVWERATKNPPVGAIDPLALATFRAASKNPTTAAKHCRQLNAMLAKLGPPGPRNRDALGILETTPWIRPPRGQNRLPFIPRDEHIVKLLTDGPRDLALFAATAALTGSRATAIRGLTRAAFDFNAQCVRFPSETDKRRGERLKPIPNVLLKWWERHGNAAKRWRITRHPFNRRFKRWTDKLGISPLRPHDLKRWWAAQLIRAGASPWCVKYALDHAQTDVTGIFYLQPFDELAEMVDKIELPAAFTEGIDNVESTQEPETSNQQIAEAE